MIGKAILQLGLGALTLCSAFSEEVDLPDVANARVTIPYSELKALWTAAQPEKRTTAPKPPVAGAVTSVRYEIDLHGENAAGVIEFDTQSFTGDWTVLPLINSDTPVEKIEPVDASIIVQDNNFALLTNRPSKQQIKMHFVAALLQEGGVSGLKIGGSPALAKLVTVRGIPADTIVRVPHATEISNGKGVATFRLAPQESLELQLLPAPTAKISPSQWQVSAQCLAKFADDVLHYTALVSATATGGSATDLNLLLPLNARIFSITGEDLASWRLDETQSIARTVALHWRSQGITSRKVEIVYELPQTVETEWTLHAPEGGDGKTAQPVFAVTANSEIELTEPNQPEAVRPPQWLSEHLVGVANVVVTRAGKISAKLLPVIDTAPAVIENAQSNMRIVSDGSLINEQNYSIRTQAPLAWTVELPNDCELLSCFVGEKRVNPINRGNGTLQVPIGPDPQGRPAQVRLAYTARVSRFAPVSGRIKVELPKTNLLINLLQWELAIPAEYDVAAFDGNVTPATGNKSGEGSTVVRFKKELCRNERPGIELFYQRPEAKK